MFHTEDSITLKPTYVNYSGPMELTQHIVKDVSICSMTIEDRLCIIVEVTLGWPLFGTFLSVFMPTIYLFIKSKVQINENII